VGYQSRGFSGAIAATLGVVLPSFLTIFAIFHVLQAFQNARIVRYAFNGIRVGVLALMIKALFGMYKKAKKSGVFGYVIMAVALVLSAFTPIDAVFIIIGAGVAGIILSLVAEKKSKKKSKEEEK
jgi:chromate transporter